MKTYRTTEIANIIGVHPNTIRLYEKIGFIPKADRQKNGYRIFTDFHIESLYLVKEALRIEILQNGLRKKMICIIKHVGKKEFDMALALIDEYGLQIHQERNNAKEAIKNVNSILNGELCDFDILLTRNEAAKHVGVTIDSLRSWEVNGLFNVKRKSNGYRVYSCDDIRKIQIINTLRKANYSLASILRMFNSLSLDSNLNIENALNNPKEEDVISACDRLLLSLDEAEENAIIVKNMLLDMKRRF